MKIFLILSIVISSSFSLTQTSDVKEYVNYDFESGYISEIVTLNSNFRDTLFCAYGKAIRQVHYDPKGQLYLEIRFYQNGRIRKSVSYDNGVENGKSYHFKKNGKVHIIFNYQNGRMVDWVEFNSKGLPIDGSDDNFSKEKR
ncbi:MAG: hypothetical protein R2799_11910 [Crocinitomicaceae bacterium]